MWNVDRIMTKPQVRLNTQDLVLNKCITNARYTSAVPMARDLYLQPYNEFDLLWDEYMKSGVHILMPGCK